MLATFLSYRMASLGRFRSKWPRRTSVKEQYQNSNVIDTLGSEVERAATDSYLRHPRLAERYRETSQSAKTQGREPRSPKCRHLKPMLSNSQCSRTQDQAQVLVVQKALIQIQILTLWIIARMAMPHLTQI